MGDQPFAALFGQQHREACRSRRGLAVPHTGEFVEASHYHCEVRRLSERVFEFSTMVVRNRIQTELMRLAAEAGKTQGEAVLSPAPAPSLSDIADRISSHREAVSRELSRLTSIGLLIREHGDLKITDVARLAKLVHDAKGE